MAREPDNVDARATVLRAGGIFCLALAACSTSPPSDRPIPRALERFADACQFVPPGMLSFSFCKEELLPAAARRPSSSNSMLVVRAGRDFLPPKGVGYGKYCGVEIWDFGADGMSVWTAPEATPPTAEIAGVSAWFTPEEERGYVAPCWRAYVGGRFALFSSERETLALALARTGRLAEILQPFDAARELADDAEDVVCALPRPGDTSYWGRKVPVEPMVTAVRPGPLRLQAFHQQPLPPEYAALFDEPWCSARQTTVRIGGWTLTEGELSPTDDAPSIAGLRSITFDLLFGLAIFI
jgi:hypothetical protein